MQAAHHKVRQQMADHVAHRHRIGMRCVEDAALGDFHAERREARPVVGDFRRDDALDAEAGIGAAIGRRHIDAARGEAGRAGVVHLDAVIEDGHSRL